MRTAETKGNSAPETAPNLDSDIHALVGTVFERFFNNSTIDNVGGGEGTVVLRIEPTRSSNKGPELSGSIAFRTRMSCSDIKVYFPEKGVLTAVRFRFSSNEEREYWKVKNEISFTPKGGERTEGQDALIIARQALTS